jgi:hypothetical protein
VWDDEDEWETLDEDYDEFEKFFKDLKKKDETIKKKTKEFNELKKNISKSSNKLHFIFSTERKKNDQLFLQKFKEENQDLKELGSFVKVGEKYNVSDNSIRKWIKKYEKYNKINEIIV